MSTRGSSRGRNAALRGTRQTRGGDFAGLVPFGVGMFVAVLVAQAVFRPPVGEPRGTAALAQAVRDAVGTAPGMWMALGCAALGARWFMLGRSDHFLRHLAGLVGLALGLALAAGGFSDVAGGAFGAAPRHALGGSAGAAMSVLLGLAVFVGAAWLAWLRGSAAISWRKWKTLLPEAGPTLPTPGVSDEEAAALLPPEPAAVALPVEEVGEPLDEIAFETTFETTFETEELPGEDEFHQVSSPYPEDVRRKGGIPAGAHPLPQHEAPADDPRAPRPAAPTRPDEAAAVYRWTPQGRKPAVEPVGADLADEEGSLREPGAQEERRRTELRAAGAVRPLGEPAAPPAAAQRAPAPLAPRPGTRPDGVAPVERAVPPPRPSWEAPHFVQEELFEGAIEEEAPTAEAFEEPLEEPLEEPEAPLAGELAEQRVPAPAAELEPELEPLPDSSELDRALRALLGGEGEVPDVATHPGVTRAPRPIDDLDSGSPAAAELDEEEEPAGAYADDDDWEVAAELEGDEESDAEADSEDELEDDWEATAELDEEDEEAEDAEDEDDSEAAAELEEDEESEAASEDELEDDWEAAAELDEEGELEEDEDDLEDSEDEDDGAVAAELEEGEDEDEESEPASDEELEDDWEAAAGLDDEEELEEAEEEADDAEDEDDWEAAAELEEDEELEQEGEPEAVAAAGPRPTPEPLSAADAEDEPAEDDSPEPEVVLEPQAAPAGSTRGGAKLSDLVVQAGCLFLERDRVAVSMLQRQFGLEFEECCKVLDELQESGLIGPYLGGQARDILMTREEWLSRVGAE